MVEQWGLVLKSLESGKTEYLVQSRKEGERKTEETQGPWFIHFYEPFVK